MFFFWFAFDWTKKRACTLCLSSKPRLPRQLCAPVRVHLCATRKHTCVHQRSEPIPWTRLPRSPAVTNSTRSMRVETRSASSMHVFECSTPCLAILWIYWPSFARLFRTDSRVLNVCRVTKVPTRPNVKKSDLVSRRTLQQNPRSLGSTHTFMMSVILSLRPLFTPVTSALGALGLVLDDPTANLHWRCHPVGLQHLPPPRSGFLDPHHVTVRDER